MNSSAIYALLLRQGAPLMAGAVSTAIFGLAVSRLVQATRKRWDDTPPTGITREDWLVAVQLPKDNLDPIRWLGNLESLGFFIALWWAYPIVIGAWLAFKVASKWETYQNIVKFPESLSGVPELEMLRARLRLGSNILQRFLLGTLGNVLCAVLGVGVGKAIQLLLSQ